MKAKLKSIIEFYKSEKGRKIAVVIVVTLLAVISVLKGAEAVYMEMNAKTLECSYESAVADYSTIKIEESIKNVFINGKRSKVIQKNTYTILKDDEDKLSSTKKEQKMHASSFDEIKGASAKYKAKGKTVTLTMTYHLKSMEAKKREELGFDMNDTIEDIKKYYEEYGYTCK